MDCCVCNSSNTEVFSTEKIPCTGCGEFTELMYNVCRDCGTMWKSVGTAVIECTLTELGDFPVDISEVFALLEDGLRGIELVDYNRCGTMGELIHKCLRCETIAYETMPGLFHCPECGFEWEVM